MTCEIPDPSAFGVSPRYGFLSPQAPLQRFPDPYYRPWDHLASDLPCFIKSDTLKETISSLPLLSADKLTDSLEYQRAYVVLAFSIHSYVWHQTPPNEKIPPQLAEPFLAVCDKLGMQPVVSYAGLCIWNWRLLDENGPMELENLDTIASFTGTRGEAAFYHVPVLIEYEAGHLMHLLLDAVNASLRGDDKIVIDALREMKETLVRISAQLAKLYSTVDAQFFYHHHRPFMAGGKGMEEKGLPRGMVFVKSNGEKVSLKLVGGSAVQSSLFPFLDYVLGVEHKDEVFEEMRSYMPGAHREFLSRVSKLPSLRPYVETCTSNIKLRDAYDDCLEQLRLWRGQHIAVVSKYVVQPAREAERAEIVDKIEVSGADDTDQEWELQGTGGSALIPFLRQAKDETVSSAG